MDKAIACNECKWLKVKDGICGAYELEYECTHPICFENIVEKDPLSGTVRTINYRKGTCPPGYNCRVGEKYDYAYLNRNLDCDYFESKNDMPFGGDIVGRD